MPKNYVLDTNVLLHDPQAILQFQENRVILPIQVIEEIDHFKRQLNELGQAARRVARFLDHCRSQGSLAEGVRLESGSLLRIDLSVKKLPDEMKHLELKPDNLILAVALRLRKQEPETSTIVVSKDINMRIKADALGLRAENYETDRIRPAEVFEGNFEVEVDPELFELFRAGQPLAFEPAEHAPHECVMLKNQNGSKATLLGRVSANCEWIEPLFDAKKPIWGMLPRNREQCYAMELLLNPEIQLVTIIGKAGSGKTLMATAAGLHQTTEQKLYQRVLISRPVYPMGKDVGFLPGSMEDKLTPWMQPFYDNVELLLEMHYGKRHTRNVKELQGSGVLAIEPLTTIRGRSIANQFLLVDEAQNLTPSEAKTILTRAGENTKVVFTGDLSQIDNPYVDSLSNGLSTLVAKFRKEPLAGHIMLAKGERSPLAELAANIL